MLLRCARDGFGKRIRHLSASAAKTVVDDMIAYARLQCHGEPNKAIDVLRSGLTSQRNKVDQGRYAKGGFTCGLKHFQELLLLTFWVSVRSL